MPNWASGSPAHLLEVFEDEETILAKQMSLGLKPFKVQCVTACHALALKPTEIGDVHTRAQPDDNAGCTSNHVTGYNGDVVG